MNVFAYIMDLCGMNFTQLVGIGMVIWSSFRIDEISSASSTLLYHLFDPDETEFLCEWLSQKV